MLSALYAELARARRDRFQRPGCRRRLRRPVVSVGNLSVGGRGKTPVVAHVAAVLSGMGERPAILSRGYGRRDRADGVVVVHDGTTIRAGLDQAGDEPLMLARRSDKTPVLVCPNRYLAGRLAELHLGATVHVLDDGFQHLPLERSVDLLIVSHADLDDPRTLPAGRLREPLAAAAQADAVLTEAGGPEGAEKVAARLGVARAFEMARHLQLPRRWDALPEGAPLEPGTRLLAVAGIARPERFFADLQELGLDIAGTVAFRDHHAFGADDIVAIVERARVNRASAIVTTEKDLMRLLPHRPFSMPVAWVPLSVTLEPAGRFQAWLAERLAAARSAAS
ncbi:MAG: tetraacyldisaccharide 4'-kinase [Acidobacteriota bacterium]